MAIRADIPGMGVRYFPEGTSEDEIYARIDEEKAKLASARDVATGGMSGFGMQPSTGGSSARQEILDTIAGTEAPDYNTLYGGRKVSDLSWHPGIDVPITSGPNKGKTSSAFGRYQFLEDTWNEQARQLGLKDMSPASQDAAAWNLASQTYRRKTGGDLEADWASGDPAARRQALSALSSVWTSLPGGIEQAARYGRRGGSAAADAAQQSMAAYKFDPRNQTTGDILKGGFARGVEGLKGTAFDLLPALGASIFGKDEYAREQLAEYGKRMEDIEQEYPTAFKSYKDVEGVGHAFDFAFETVGENGADIAAFLLGAGAGSSLFKRGALKAFEGQLEKHLASDRFKDYTEAQKDALIERYTNIALQGAKEKAGQLGGTIGTGLVSEAINVPETFQQIYQDTGKLEPGIAMGMGSLSAALDTIVPKQIFDQLTGAQRQAFKAALINQSEVVPASFKKAFLAETGKIMAEEGLTEGTQEAINNLASNFAGANKDIMEGVLDASIKGAIGGTAFGMPGAALEAYGRKAATQEEIDRREYEQLQADFRRQQADQMEADRIQQAEQARRQRIADISAAGPEAQLDMFPEELEAERQYVASLPRLPQLQPTENERRARAEAGMQLEAERQAPRQMELPGEFAPYEPTGDKAPVTREGEALMTPRQRAAYEAQLAAAEQQRKEDLLRRQGTTYPPGHPLAGYGQQRGEPTQLDMFPAEKAAAEGAARRGIPTYAEPAAGAAPVEPQFSPVVTPELLKSVGLTPQSGFFKQLVGKDITKPKDRKIIEGVIDRVQKNPKLAQSTKDGVRSLYTQAMAMYGKQGEMFTPTGRVKKGVSGARVPTGDVGGRAGAGAQVPSGPGVGVPAGGVGVSEPTGVASPEPTATGPERGEAAQPSALTPPAQPTVDPDSLKYAQYRAKIGRGSVVWSEGPLHLVKTHDRNGNVNYIGVKGEDYSVLSVDRMRPDNTFTSKDIQELKKARDAHEVEAKAKHAANPFVKFDANGLAFSDSIPNEVRAILSEWKKMLNIKSDVYIGTFDDAAKDADKFTGPHSRIGRIDKTGRSGVTGKLDDGSRLVLLDPFKSPIANLEVLAHEFGHIHEKEMFNNAPQATQAAIRKDFDDWYAKRGGKTAKQFIQSLRARKAGKLLGEGMRDKGEFPEEDIDRRQYEDYYSSFAEWYADQVSRWATTSEKPVSVVEKYFKRLADAIKRFFSQLQNAGYLPSNAVKKYLDSIADNVANDPIITEAEDTGLEEMRGDLGPSEQRPLHEQIALPDNLTSPDGPFKVASSMGRLAKKIPFFDSGRGAALAGALDQASRSVRSAALSLVPGIALSDMASRYFPKGMAEMYHKLITQHDGFIHTHASNVIEPITNVFRRAMKTSRQQHPLFDKLTDLSTKEQVDPTDNNSIIRATQFSMGYLTFDAQGNQTGREIKYFDTAVERDDAIRAHNAGKPRYERAFRVRDADEGTRRAAREVMAMWNQLSPEWKNLYRTIKNANVKTFDLLRQTLSDRIDSHDLDDSAKILLKKDIFTRLAESGMITPYFALTREGDHWLSAEVPNQHGVYENITTAFKDPLSREKFQTNLKNMVYQFERRRGTSHEEAMDVANQRVRSYSRIDEIDYRNMPSSAAINSIFKIIDGKRPRQTEGESDTDYRARMEQYDNIEKDIMQMVIKAMPETSILKSLRPRENTPGNLLDTMGSFERKQRSMVRQIANLKYRPKIRDNLDGMAQYADILGRGQDEVRDPATGQLVQPKILPQDNDMQVQYLNAFKKHSAYFLNPTPQELAGITKSLIFGGTMAFNPSSAIIEYSNVPMIVYPYMAAEYGANATRGALSRAAKIFTSSGDSRTVTPWGSEEDPEVRDEKLKAGWSMGNYAKNSREYAYYGPLIEAAASSGMLNRSQLYENLLSSSRTGIMDKWNAAAGWMLHRTSAFNREVTMMAAYSLEFEKLKKQRVPVQEAAERAAQKAIYTAEITNGSVASADAPRFAHNSLGSIVMMYKRFGITNMYMQMKMVREAYGKPPERLAGESAEEYAAKVRRFKQEAAIMKRRFAGLQLSTALFSGLHGLPLYGAAAAMYNLFKDDDEDDADTATQKAIGDLFFNGPLEYYSGISIASRIGLSGLIFKEPKSGGETASFSEMMMDSVGGPLPGMVDRLENGVNMINNGNVWRGMEAMMPAALSNLMKAARYIRTGRAETLRGDPIYNDVDAMDAAITVLGFAPVEVRKRQEFNAKQMGLAKAEAAKDSNIKGRYYKAYREHDRAGMQEAKEMLLEFGQRHPHLKYTPSTINEVLRKSVKKHDQDTKNMIMGKSYAKAFRPVVRDAMEDLGIDEE
jgi:muramidase (phage lysozyme)